jgi:hypothetical protein
VDVDGKSAAKTKPTAVRGSTSCAAIVDLSNLIPAGMKGEDLPAIPGISMGLLDMSRAGARKSVHETQWSVHAQPVELR